MPWASWWQRWDRALSVPTSASNWLRESTTMPPTLPTGWTESSPAVETDNSFLLKASTQASKVADYLLSFSPAFAESQEASVAA